MDITSERYRYARKLGADNHCGGFHPKIPRSLATAEGGRGVNLDTQETSTPSVAMYSQLPTSRRTKCWCTPPQLAIRATTLDVITHGRPNPFLPAGRPDGPIQRLWGWANSVTVKGMSERPGKNEWGCKYVYARNGGRPNLKLERGADPGG